MFKKLIALFILGCPFVAFGQLLSVTATLTDSDSTLWKNATCTVAVNSPNGAPFFGTTPVPTAPQTCSVNGSGVLSTSIYNTSTITPTGATYTFSIQSATSAAASTFQTTVTAANQTSNLSGLITAPRFNASVAFAYGYVDAEAIAIAPGAQYYNTTTPAGRVWTGSAWTASGGGSGGTPCTTTNGALQYDNSGAFGCSILNQITNGITLTTSTGASPLYLGFMTGATAYNAITFNNAPANFTDIGMIGGGTGDPGLYFDIQTGGAYNARIGNGTTYITAVLPIITPSATLNAAVCVVVAGPPLILGTCTSVVGAGGGCTCH